MAFISRAPRSISFSNSTGTNNNIYPGSYDHRSKGENSRQKLSNVPFGSCQKRKLAGNEPSTDLEEIDFQVQSRNNFQYESDVIKRYLRKPMPNYSFDSTIKRIPDAKKLTNSPDPGKYYKDDLKEKCQQLHEAGLFIKQKLDKNDTVNTHNNSSKNTKNLPSIPGRNEQFGYTYLDMNPKNAVKNFNPNILEGSNNNSAGPGHYDLNYNELEKHIPANKMSITGGLGKRKRNPIPETGTGNYVGPGSYDPHFMVPNYKFKPSPNFMSNGPRSNLDDEQRKFTVKKQNPNQNFTVDYYIDATPGPGAYYNREKNSAFCKQTKKKEKFQLFNSSSPRFDDMDYQNLLGPGSYNVAKKSYQKKTFNQRSVSFNHEAVRDLNCGINTKNIVPGPGEYSYPYSMGENASRKLGAQLRKMDRRKANKSEIIDISTRDQSKTLDPNYSKIEPGILENSQTDAQNMRSIFENDVSSGSQMNNISAIKKGSESPKIDGPSAYESLNKKSTNLPSPGPGHYHKLHANPKFKKGNTDYIFTSAQDRFKSVDDDTKEYPDSMPAIGEYDLGYHDIYQEKNYRKANTKPFGSSERRFKGHFSDQQAIEEEDIIENVLLGDEDAKVKNSEKGFKDPNQSKVDDEVKYKFDTAFGGGYKGNLIVDNPIKSGQQAPFGTNNNRFTKKKHDEIRGPGHYHQRPTMERKSYNILFL